MDPFSGTVKEGANNDVAVTASDLGVNDLLIYAFNVPAGPWSSVWRRGNGPLLDKDEIVEITVFLRNLYPPLGKNTDFSIRLRPIDGEVLMIRRSTPSKLTGFMELKR